jgi:hypothetical protein
MAVPPWPPLPQEPLEGPPAQIREGRFESQSRARLLARATRTVVLVGCILVAAALVVMLVD